MSDGLLVEKMGLNSVIAADYARLDFENCL